MKILQGALLAATLLTLCSCSGGSSGKHPARAKKHFDEGRYENAQVEYRKALQSEPKRAEIWRELGLTYMKQSKPEQAHESFNQALVLRPDDVDAARDLAQLLLPAYWQSGHKAKPLGDRLDKLAEILLRNEAGSFMGNRVRGHLAVGARQPEKAIQHFQAALRGKPGDADSAYMLVETAFDSLGAPQAEAFAKRFVAANPTVAPAYERLARWLEKHGRLSEAEKYRRLWIQNVPNDLGARVQLANFLHSAGRHEDAERAVAELASLRSKHPQVRMLVGEYYQKTGKLDRALAEYSSGEGENPKSALAYRKLRLSVLLQQNDLAQAKTLLDSVAVQHRDDPEILLSRALFDMDSRDPALVDRAVRSLQQLQSVNAAAAHQLGNALVRKGDPGGAQAAFRNAVRMNPSNLSPRLDLMRLFASRLRYKDLMDEADGVLAIAPANRDALLQRIAALRALNRAEEAQSFLNQVREKRKDSQVTELDLDLEQGLIFAYRKRYADAEPLLRRHYKPGHSNARLVTSLAEVLTAQGKYEECLRLLQADVLAKPNRPLMLYALGEVQARLGNATHAGESFKRAMETGPEMGVAYRRFAEIQMDQGNVDQAVSCLRIARQRFSKDPSIVAAFARSMEMRGDWVEAEKAYREWMTLDPRSPVPLNNLAFLLAETNRRPAEAVELSVAATRLSPDNPAFADTLGYAYWRNGQNRAGMDVFSRLTRANPEPVYYYHYALVLHSSGRMPQARQALEAALGRNPEPKLKQLILDSLART